jgi:hypothetical protein
MSLRPSLATALLLPVLLSSACATASSAGAGRPAETSEARTTETKAPPPAEPALVPVQRESAARWSQLSLSQRCEAMNPAYCVGFAGFTLGSDGTWRVGPDPAGNVLKGALTPEERSRLADAVAALEPLSSSTTPLCHQQSGPGSGSSLTLVHSAAGEVPVYQSFMGNAGPDCTGERGGRVMALVGVVQELLGRYYPRPFPAGPRR